MYHKNNIFAEKGHEFLQSIEAFFENWEATAPQGQDPIRILYEGKKISIKDLRTLLHPLDCISNRFNVITMKSEGKRNFDGYFVLNYEDATVEFTPMGAWQVSLLLISSNIMPLFWHANYVKISLILTKNDLHRLRKRRGYSISNHKFIPPDTVCAPSVRPLEDGKSYEVIYHYWTEFGGYIEHQVIITCPKGFGASCKIKDLTIKTEVKRIYPYRARIMF